MHFAVFTLGTRNPSALHSIRMASLEHTLAQSAQPVQFFGATMYFGGCTEDVLFIVSLNMVLLILLYMIY